MAAAKKLTTATYRDFAGRRWLVSVLRAMHLAGMVGVGAGLLGAAPAMGVDAFLALLVISGVAMVSLDFWSNPGYPRQVAGAAMLAKLGLLVWYALDVGHRIWLFWLILAVSSLTAHAPARLRHRRLIRSGKPPASLTR